MHLPLDPPSIFGKGSPFLQACAANLHVIRKSASHRAWLPCSAPRPASARLSRSRRGQSSVNQVCVCRQPKHQTDGERDRLRGRNCHVSIWTIFTVGGNCLGQDGSRRATRRPRKKTRAARRRERKEGRKEPPRPNKWSLNSVHHRSYFAVRVHLCAPPSKM